MGGLLFARQSAVIGSRMPRGGLHGDVVCSGGLLCCVAPRHCPLRPSLTGRSIHCSRVVPIGSRFVPRVQLWFGRAATCVSGAGYVGMWRYTSVLQEERTRPRAGERHTRETETRPPRAG
eukprot:3275916-Prymnesium_polylepis.1